MNISKLRSDLKKSSNISDQTLSGLALLEEHMYYQALDACKPYSRLSYLALLYLVDMAKDARDTFTPYKSHYHQLRDLLQLFRGLGNVIFGLGILSSILCMILLLLATTTLSAIILSAITTTAITQYYVIAAATAETLTWALTGLYSILIFPVALYYLREEFKPMPFTFILSLALLTRGITQIATAPLTLLRMAFRNIWFRKTPYENANERPDVKQYAAEIGALINNTETNSKPDTTLKVQSLLTAMSKKIYKNNQETLRSLDKEIKNATIPLPSRHPHFVERIITPNNYAKLSTDAKIRLFAKQERTSFNAEWPIPPCIKEYLRQFNYFGPELTIIFNLCEKYKISLPIDAGNNLILDTLYKKLVLKLHPDKNPTAKQDYMALDKAWDDLKSSRKQVLPKEMGEKLQFTPLTT